MSVRTLLLVLATHCLLTIAEDEMASFNGDEIKKKCMEEHKVKEEDLAPLNNTKYLETKDQNIKCLVKCFLTELKLMNEAGDVTLDDVKVRNPKAAEHYAKCENSTGTDACDKAVNFQNCMWKEMQAEKESEEKPTK